MICNLDLLGNPTAILVLIVIAMDINMAMGKVRLNPKADGENYFHFIGNLIKKTLSESLYHF
jgi:hypothetical protein